MRRGLGIVHYQIVFFAARSKLEHARLKEARKHPAVLNALTAEEVGLTLRPEWICASCGSKQVRLSVACRTAVYLSFGPIVEKRMHALKGLACRKRVAAASSPAATCKQGAALTSPA